MDKIFYTVLLALVSVMPVIQSQYEDNISIDFLIQKWEIDKATSLCKENGGLLTIAISATSDNMVICGNGLILPIETAVKQE